MTPRIFAAGTMIGALLAVSPARALTCIDHLINGIGGNCSTGVYGRNMSGIQQNTNNAWAGYLTGFVRGLYSAGGVLYVEATYMDELYSDRKSGNQPFLYTAKDQDRVQIYANGTIVIYSYTWGFTTTLTATCVGDLIMGQYSGGMYSFSWGPLVPIVC